jgi:hypothetical protein
MSYRFRVDDGKLVLQVYAPPKTGPYDYDRTGTWRDAQVEDIPVTDMFTRVVEREPSRYTGDDSFNAGYAG